MSSSAEILDTAQIFAVRSSVRWENLVQCIRLELFSSVQQQCRQSVKKKAVPCREDFVTLLLISSVSFAVCMSLLRFV